MTTHHTEEVEGHKVVIENTSEALFLQIEGCTDAVSEPGNSAQLRLDWYYGHPTLYIWADKESEDPTIISLAKALEQVQESPQA